MFTAYIPEFCELYAINFINLISPGAGCLLMVRNSTFYNKKIGLYTAFGIVSSSFIHKSYSLLGFGLVVAKTPWLFFTVKYLGASYLFYLGLKTIFLHTRFFNGRSKKKTSEKVLNENLTPWGAYRMGFIVDMLNPSASLSFVLIVVATVSLGTPFPVRVVYMLILITTSLLWYTSLAFFFSQKRLQAWAQASGKVLDWVMGSFLFYLAIKLFLLSPPMI